MIKHHAILLLLNIISAEDFQYKYDDYTDDEASLELYDISKTEKSEAVVIDNSINLINSGDIGVNYTTNGFPDQVTTEHRLQSPRTQRKRECNFTVSKDEPVNSPVPDVKDNIATYPFAASVLRMGSHYASGALVDKRWVLSAAGVFYNVRESIKLYRVRLGSVNCKRGGSLLPLQQIVIHSSYVPGKPENDLALLRLSQPVEISSSVHPVSLTERKGKVEIGKFLTMYWPRLVVDGKSLPASAKERLQHTNMRVSTQRVIPWKQCWRAMSYRHQELTQNSFCLRPLKQFHSICMPDVGAPVLSQDGLWGVVSGWVGAPCSYSDPSPVLVSRVSPPAVRYWLEAQFEHED